MLRAMRILVIGGGGREHALVWKLGQSALATKIWCAPGNGGISDEAECVAVDAGDVKAIADLAAKLKAELTVIGPELPLVRGVVDEFVTRGLTIVGPSRAAAELEGSKVFAKEFMERHGIPTAKMLGTFSSREDAEKALEWISWPAVIKADGLCAGKGVLVAKDRAEAAEFLDRLMVAKEFGEGGSRVLMEEAISGPEISVIVLTDGKQIARLAPARDYKRVNDGDAGPNTGGMGAVSSDELLPKELGEQIQKAIVEPTIRGMAEDGRPYCGFLYFGLMLTAAGPKVLEFNCRLGDPETEAIIPRMNFDLAAVLRDTAAGKLDPAALRWSEQACACVVMTAGGYPGKFRSGDKISGLEKAGSIAKAKVFHSGTRKDSGGYYTSGGRVLAVTALGPDVEMARRSCYDVVSFIGFEGEHHRKDVGASTPAISGSGGNQVEFTPRPRLAAGV
jgi:phosphoribosylamine---glycine ligase